MSEIDNLLEMVDLIRLCIGKDPIDTLCRSRKLKNNKNQSKNGRRKVQKQMSTM